MNCVQSELLNLASCAIRGERLESIGDKDINWDELLQIANNHHIMALVYTALPDREKLRNVDENILHSLRKDTIVTAIGQMQHISQVTTVLKKFNEAEIDVIALKGLVIRELYPRPELRTMCDADILVKKSDLASVKKIMEGLGYKEGEKSPVHISYMNKNYHLIEIHWTIEDTRFFNNSYELEEDMWNHAEKFKIGDCEILSFSPEDLAIHLCLHMAVHILTRGFGIRQLCDMVLLVEKRGHLINWQSFIDKGRKWGIEGFILTIFMTCKQLFDLKIPLEIERHSRKINSKTIRLLTDDILSGGVYGKRDLAHLFAHELAYDSKEYKGGNIISIIARFIVLIFPPISRMSHKYSYAKKYKVLLPVAWLHHLISGVFHNTYGVRDKTGFLMNSIFISIKRNKLLRKLQL